MKKLMTFLFCVTLAICSNAQKAKVETPAAVKAAFSARYPAAQKVKWSIEKPGEFEAEFTQNKVESSALFDAAGKFLESEVEIREAELPQGVKTTLTKDFSGYKLDEIEQASDAKGVSTYEMEASKGKVKLELSFDSTGKLLSQKPLKKEDKD